MSMRGVAGVVWASPGMERSIGRDLDFILKAMGNTGKLEATHCQHQICFSELSLWRWVENGRQRGQTGSWESIRRLAGRDDDVGGCEELGG